MAGAPIKPNCIPFWILLAIANLGLVLLVFALAPLAGLIPAGARAEAAAYLIGLPAAALYCLPRLRHACRYAHSPRRRSAFTAFRFVMIQAATWAAVLLLLEELIFSEALLLIFLPLSFVLNFLLVHNAPRLVR